MYQDVSLFIDGAWTPAASGRTLPVVNPATGDVIGTVAHAERADLDRALSAAERGFQAWRKVSAFDRSKVMRKAANLLRERVDAIAPLLTMEQGKPLPEAKGEVLAGADVILPEHEIRHPGRLVGGSRRRRGGDIVSAAAPFVAIRSGAASALPPKTITVASMPPALVMRGEALPAAGPARRTKIWEFNTNLHCSIIGTCLSTGELRQVLKKLGFAPPGSTDHELHGAAVSLAGRHDKAAKLLNKTLDERHRLAIRRFEKANTEDAVRALWADGVRRGEIPGAYWATLTHPAATHAVIRGAFGEVHMLSHLVGAANRADIRRLCQLEADNTALQARLDRQQAALRDAVVTRDACIRELRQALAQRIAAEQPVPGEDNATLRQLVADLERRLAGEARRSSVLEERLAAAKAIIAEERSARAKAERECSALRRELDVIEASVLAGCDDNSLAIASAPQLDGVTVLYVGGRPNQVAHLRAAAERSGAAFLHHDGGIEHHLNLLAGLTSQADVVVFPVDCISHHAAQTAKLLCRQTGKRFVPLRSAGATSLLAALRRPEVTGQADAAD